jgi:hypothetical protein
MTNNVTDARQENAGYVYQDAGPVLYGAGEPRDTAGHVGNVYTDTQTNYVYQKRGVKGIGQWGQYIFSTPSEYVYFTRWYRSDIPPPGFGNVGDYALVWSNIDFSNLPALYGPKGLDNSWPLIASPGFVVNPNADIPQ